jgi:glycosidase
MNSYFKITLCFLLLVSSFSCQDEEENEPIPVETIDPDYVQFGTPFNNTPATEDIILYEVNLRAFSPSGTIAAVTAKLDHIENLGVNVIWLMPIHPDGQINSVNSPYSVKDYKAVSPEYGTLEDLREFTEEAHSRGIAVIMDWVANHTSWDNEWIANDSWYSKDASGNIIHPAGTNWLDVADLNYGNVEMRTAMIDAMKYWIYEANIDGYRSDYADGVPFTFWREAIDSLNEISNKDYIFFAEGERIDHFSAGFDLNFGWQSYSAIKDVFGGQPAGKIFTADQNEYENLPGNKHWVRFTTNHDESAWDATPMTLFNGKDGALAASAITIFNGGIPLIYGSQEVGTVNTIPFFTNSAINWDLNPSMLESYRTMLNFYANSDTSKQRIKTIYADDDVVCFKKVLDNEEVLIISNVRNYAVTFNIPSLLQGTFWNDIISSNTITLNNQLILSPYEYYILKK